MTKILELDTQAIPEHLQAQLFELINEAFSTGWKRSYVFKPESQRLETFNTFLEDLPGAKTIILLEDGVICATVSYKKYVHEKGPNTLWPKPTPPSDDYANWIIKYFVTNPNYGRRGYGKQVLDIVERNIAEISKPKTAKILLDTLKEENEEYYLKRGFVTTEVIDLEKGVFDSNRPFQFAFMEKIVSCKGN